MKETIKIVSVLTIVCILCAFLLAFVNNAARGQIASNDTKKIEDAIGKLAPLFKKTEKLNIAGEEIYKLFDAKGEVLGYAFLAKGDGYQGVIKVLAVINPQIDKLEGIEIIESVETPGLGARIKEDFFRNQFKNLKVSVPIECVKENITQDNQIKAISSATISSKSLVNILNKKISELKKQLANQ
ncbi:MAG: FMN-binding protein [Candidatus Omnitrophota bacterium]